MPPRVTKTSKRRTRKTVKRSTTSSVVEKGVDDESGHVADDADASRIADHRRRIGSIESILESTLGASARDHPELWDRHAYLLLVGHVYERLATGGEDISTEELLKLAKTLAENRRANAQAQKQAGADETDDDENASPPSPTDQLPENFAQAIRQVYGVRITGPT